MKNGQHNKGYTGQIVKVDSKTLDKTINEFDKQQCGQTFDSTRDDQTRDRANG